MQLMSFFCNLIVKYRKIYTFVLLYFGKIICAYIAIMKKSENEHLELLL